MSIKGEGRKANARTLHVHSSEMVEILQIQNYKWTKKLGIFSQLKIDPNISSQSNAIAEVAHHNLL